VKWLKHAFAVEAAGRAEPSETQRILIEKLCREVVRRRMTTPALLMLEMGRPLNYVSAQLLHFFQPMLTILANAGEYQAFTEFLEQRGSIDYIVTRLESLNQEASTTSHGTD
jgi:hypothetical protein